MGERSVFIVQGESGKKDFIQNLLKDIEALQILHDKGAIESGITRIGVEQELCLVDPAWRPAPINLDVLKRIDDQHYTTELARFNMEINLDPLDFKGACLSRLEKNLRDHLLRIEQVNKKLGAKLILTGILPTIRTTDLDDDMMTPIDRYRALDEIMRTFRGGDFEMRIEGTDELIARNPNVMFESCNTSYQIHYQVNPDEFAKRYNWSQAIAAPVLAIATNSPLLFGRRLWHETRIALFQQSVDIRNSRDLMRQRSPRVNFGTRWAEKSIVDVFQEDIVRYKILLGNKIKNDSLKQVNSGKLPSLEALRVHNSTIYKWNRPCVGIGNGKMHVRIENRLLPSGPSVKDQVANSALWFGLMHNNSPDYGDIPQRIDFDDAKTNLLRAARQGIDAKLTWLDGKKMAVQDIVLKELLPAAEAGLERAKISKKDRDHYLGIIEARTKSGRTGAQWIVESYNKLRKEGTVDEALVATTAGMYHRQRDGSPVHEWDLARITEAGSWSNYYWRIDQIMATDLFAVQQDDFIDLVASIMDWRHVRHVPVENKKGELVGLITSGILVKYLFESRRKPKKKDAVKDIMIKKPVAISPETLTKDALKLMQEHKIGCLPVVKNKRLVGIVTEHDFVDISRRLLKELSTD